MQGKVIALRKSKLPLRPVSASSGGRRSLIKPRHTHPVAQDFLLPYYRARTSGPSPWELCKAKTPSLLSSFAGARRLSFTAVEPAPNAKSDSTSIVFFCTYQNIVVLHFRGITCAKRTRYENTKPLSCERQNSAYPYARAETASQTSGQKAHCPNFSLAGARP